MLTTLRELAGDSMIMLPSSDFANPEMVELIEKTQQSPAASATEKVKFYKLAWDAVGSEFASRHQQYEMFYAGASFVVKNHSFRTFDWADTTGLLDRMLGSYQLEDDLGAAESGGGLIGLFLFEELVQGGRCPGKAELAPAFGSIAIDALAQCGPHRRRVQMLVWRAGVDQRL